jgi:hypothetical protein
MARLKLDERLVKLSEAQARIVTGVILGTGSGTGLPAQVESRPQAILDSPHGRRRERTQVGLYFVRIQRFDVIAGRPARERLATAKLRHRRARTSRRRGGQPDRQHLLEGRVAPVVAHHKKELGLVNVP